MNWDGTQPESSALPARKLTPFEKLAQWWHRTDDPTIHFFHGLLVVHIVLWSALPMLMHHNPTGKTLQLLTLGREFAFGYHQQAPLPAWLAIASCSLTGTAVWPTYILAATCGAICLWCAWILGRQYLQPWTAVCAAMAMEACFYFNYTVPVLSSETIGRTFWALGVLAFFYALKSGRRTNWVQTAICLGLGLLCRYDTLFLMAAMLLFTFWNDRARKCWDTSRPFLATAIVIAIVFPHGWWVMNHLKGQETSLTNYLLAAEHTVEITSHPVTEALALLPVLFVLAPLVNWLNPAEEAVDEEREMIRQYLAWVCFMPPAIMAALAMVNGLHFDSLWMSPLWVYGGLLFVLWSRLEETRFAWRQALVWTGTATGVIAGFMFATYVLFAPSMEFGLEAHFPGPEVAHLVRTTWDNSYPGHELQAVGGDRWMTGNVAWFDTTHPNVYANLDSSESPLMGDEKFKQTGGVIILNGDADNSGLKERIAKSFTEAHPLPVKQVAWQHTAQMTKPLNVELVMVPPAEIARELQAARALLQMESPAQTLIVPQPQFQSTIPTRAPQQAVVTDPAITGAGATQWPNQPQLQQPIPTSQPVVPDNNPFSAPIPRQPVNANVPRIGTAEAESDEVIPQFPFKPRQ